MVQSNSRRGFLTGGAVALAGAPIPASALTTSADDCAQQLWARWIALISYVDAGLDNKRSDKAMERVLEIEANLKNAEPSVAAAAALILRELYITLADIGATIAGAPQDDELTTLVATLRHLRPMVRGGLIGTAVADVLDHPDEPIDDHLFGRRRSGEA